MTALFLKCHEVPAMLAKDNESQRCLQRALAKHSWCGWLKCSSLIEEPLKIIVHAPAVPLAAVTLDRDLSLHFYAPAANGDSDNYSSERDFCEGLGGVRRVQVMQIPKS